ncbi:TetR/AcrR family transcriptional regulator [Rhodococcus sp. HNM0563]|uniref:helix-turn-helix domain-containing protein n=1 Tax=Rhodococcus sp. HNM0563 TaxID=2716339 RepID=UPI00146B2F44|nr:helix-turn-helix domain-containing protein [Rhodococcus sp. HNM0563]NLU63650.1 TetR/AcrR family transcriptional regulator [Rhodococcus sp. HNM0563]
MSDAAPGRPRDPRIDAEVLATAREMLVEVGWDGLSMRALAARAGVGRATLTRRWPTKAHLVLHALLGAAPDLEPYTGIDRRGWIEWVVTGSVELFSRPDVRAALPGLLAALRDHDDLRNALWRTFSGPSTALFAGETGHDSEIDARAILVMAAGSALFAGLIAAEDDTPELRARILELLLPAAEG